MFGRLLIYRDFCVLLSGYMISILETHKHPSNDQFKYTKSEYQMQSSNSQKKSSRSNMTTITSTRKQKEGRLKKSPEIEEIEVVIVDRPDPGTQVPDLIMYPARKRMRLSATQPLPRAGPAISVGYTRNTQSQFRVEPSTDAKRQYLQDYRSSQESFQKARKQGIHRYIAETIYYQKGLLSLSSEQSRVGNLGSNGFAYLPRPPMLMGRQHHPALTVPERPTR